MNREKIERWYKNFLVDRFGSLTPYFSRDDYIGTSIGEDGENWYAYEIDKNTLYIVRDRDIPKNSIYIDDEALSISKELREMHYNNADWKSIDKALKEKVNAVLKQKKLKQRQVRLQQPKMPKQANLNKMSKGV